MVRTSRAVLIGSVAVFFVAIISFLTGWTMAHALSGTSLNQFVTATVTRHPGDGTAPADVRADFAVFWDVWDLVYEEFYTSEPLDQRQMIYGAIRGMLQSLNDDYTVFQEPETAERNRESLQGSFEGIGIYMQVAEGNVLVERPIEGSPAMKAGLQSGDIIVMIDGERTASLIDNLSEAEAMDAVAERIRGPRGSTVTLTIRRPPETSTFEVPIVRDEVPLISVHGQMLADDIAYIQITEFKATTTAEFDKTLRELLPQEPAGLILDLRSNPGGFLDTSREILGRFYEGVALYEELNNGEQKEFRTEDAPADVRVYDLPLVVLVNGQSASASEIVAGALRDKRADTTLLGETSFGKGSVQNIHRLRDGSSVRITIAHWLTPDGEEIHEVGITPDYAVPDSQDPAYAVPCTGERLPPEDKEHCFDAQLSTAIELLHSNDMPASAAPE